jgi:hypothetical protein
MPYAEDCRGVSLLLCVTQGHGQLHNCKSIAGKTRRHLLILEALVINWQAAGSAGAHL